jgi:peptidoglycan/LPS O-acetylase OafA/YrhL
MNTKNTSTRAANNITLLRHFAAFFVLITHSFDLTDNFKDETLRKLTGESISFSKIGLIIFFFISGFLITQSLITSVNLKQFIWKRFLRIYPALFVLILSTVFLLGPLFTTFSTKDYFLNNQTWSYLFGTTLVRLRFVLPGVFHGGGVNGSLWSLPIEFRLYLLLALLSLIGLVKRRSFYFVFVSGFIVFGIFALPFNLQSRSVSYFVPYLSWGVYFFIGSFVFFIKDKLIVDYKILILLLILWYALRDIEIANRISELMCFSYLTLWLSFKTPVVFSDFFKRNDFSYSMYLYAYPIQQIFIHRNPDITPAALIVVSSIALIPFCWFSWNFIEKPSLKLKKRI